MKLPILHYPDKRLRTIAKEVSKVDDETRLLVKNMFETMYDAPGIGLAATQILILLLTKPTQCIGYVNPDAILITGVRAPAMKHGSRIHQY